MLPVRGGQSRQKLNKRANSYRWHWSYVVPGSTGLLQRTNHGKQQRRYNFVTNTLEETSHSSTFVVPYKNDIIPGYYYVVCHYCCCLAFLTHTVRNRATTAVQVESGLLAVGHPPATRTWGDHPGLKSHIAQHFTHITPSAI